MAAEPDSAKFATPWAGHNPRARGPCSVLHRTNPPNPRPVTGEPGTAFTDDVPMSMPTVTSLTLARSRCCAPGRSGPARCSPGHPPRDARSRLPALGGAQGGEHVIVEDAVRRDGMAAVGPRDAV